MVLDAALSIAVDHGIPAVTIGAVAQRLNVTRAVVYSCFADRVEVIDALLAREADYLHGAVLNALHAATDDDPESAFIGRYRALLRLVDDRPGSWRLVFSAQPDPAVAERFAAARADVAANASRWIRSALQAWWDVADLERKLPVLVEFFISSCEAAARSLLDPVQPWGAAELGELYGRLMVHALRAA
jgi:AcrR family transcriptional regulator